MWALQAAEKLCFVTGHDFSRAANALKSTRALQAAEKLGPEGGGGFNPRIKPTGSMPALAAEGRVSPISPKISSSSATSLAPEGMLRPKSNLIRDSLNVKSQDIVYRSAAVLKGHGFTGCGKTGSFNKVRTMVTSGCSRNDPKAQSEGFLSPIPRAFWPLSEFFRSLQSPCPRKKGLQIITLICRTMVLDRFQ